VTVKLVDAKQSGKIAGRTELALALTQIRVKGQWVDINTQTVSEKSTNRAGRSAGTIGGGAIGGAILGGILGGGKGAAIGAAGGAAGGTAVELATKGQRVRVPSETRLTFVLDNPINI
jgi:outer membrane lipoprotein SlyB